MLGSWRPLSSISLSYRKRTLPAGATSRAARFPNQSMKDAIGVSGSTRIHSGCRTAEALSGCR
jgi:hypothetical protein